MGKKYRKKSSSSYGRRKKLRVKVKPTRFKQSAKTYTIRRKGKKITVHRKAKLVTRKGYTAKRKDVGAPGRGKKVIKKIERGKLKKYGYSTSKSTQARHKALAKAVKAYGSDEVWHMLHAQIILRLHQKGKAAKTRKIFEQDRDWIAQKYGGPVPTKAIQVWTSMSHRERQIRMPGGKI